MDQYTNLTNLIAKLNTWKDNMAAIFGNNDEYVRGIAACCAEIAKAPVADVVPVIHGYWSDIRNVVLDEIGTCSVCGERRDVDSYCSNCGAIMDKEKEKLSKKPIKDKKSNRITLFKCPRCGAMIAYKISERFVLSTLLKNNICSCGQEIDWSEEKEE